MTVDSSNSYGTALQDNELLRLNAVAAEFDQFTTAQLRRLPLPTGGAILEVGPGAGTIARWMRDTFEPGQLVVLDHNAALLERSSSFATHTVQADLNDTVPQPGEFDLIHARFVLMHLPRRQHVLEQLASWLRPGGWLVVGDSLDTSSLTSDSRAVAAGILLRQATEALMGSSFTWATTFPSPLRQAGLDCLGVAAHVATLATGSSACATLDYSIRRLVSAADHQRSVDTEQLRTVLPTLRDPDLLTLAPLGLAIAWGQRPLPDHGR